MSLTGASATAASKKGAMPWVEKYRPRAIDDIISHEEIMNAMKKLIASNSLPHLLFYGPPGTGKTTTVLSCARLIYGEGNLRGTVLELNASDDRGIDVVRNQIKDFAGTAQVFSSVAYKLIILDEADQMSNEAQAALRRVIERYTRTVRFCLICNHVNKIIPAVQSRCTRFRFGPLKKVQMMPRLSHVLQQEGIEFDEIGVTAAIRLSGGDMRRCLNILQGSVMSFGNVSEDSIYRTTGSPDLKSMRVIIEMMVGRAFPEAYRGVVDLATSLGLSCTDLVREVHPFVLRMDFNDDVKGFLLERMAKIEHSLAVGGSEALNTAAMVSAFQIAKEAVTRQVSPWSLVKGLAT
eukprot:PhM_4_TR14306/c0_g1_i1/m.45868/K10756/RFC3_5; replication factor C subunit 3/5